MGRISLPDLTQNGISSSMLSQPPAAGAWPAGATGGWENLHFVAAAAHQLAHGLAWVPVAVAAAGIHAVDQR